jgi:uncharacterized membrane protein
MKNFYKLIWIIAVIGFVAVSCGNWFGGEDEDGDDSNSGNNTSGNNPGDQNPSDGGPNNATVYVSDYNNGIAFYWENETEKDLPIAGSEGYTTGITVQGGNVYISGGFISVDYLPIGCYWKDGTRIDLGVSGGTEGYTTGISVQGGNVYVSGSYIYDDGGRIYGACYWKDGTRVDLPIPDGTQSIATGISVQGDNVYVSGIYGSSFFSYKDGGDKTYSYGVACYWKDGTRVDLPIPDGTQSIATGISVQGDNVYVAGVYRYSSSNSVEGTACYWKDGTRIDLGVSGGTQGITTGITVQGGDVYISGNYGNSACYWKNETRTDLSGLTTSGIVIQSGNVYVSGIYVVYSGIYPFEYPCYWVNGTRVNLRDRSTYNNHIYTTGIAVVSH